MFIENLQGTLYTYRLHFYILNLSANRFIHFRWRMRNRKPDKYKFPHLARVEHPVKGVVGVQALLVLLVDLAELHVERGLDLLGLHGSEQISKSLFAVTSETKDYEENK